MIADALRHREKKFNILIVDDVSKNIQYVAGILSNEGYEPAFAQDGATALALLDAHRFDLVLLDVMMPGMDGFEVCRRMKETPSAKDVPVIFLTAKTDMDSIVKGFDIGAADYVTKPFNSAELLARVKTHLELNSAREQLRIANAAKDKFFSIIAHDLKNPLSGLLGLIDLFRARYPRYDDEKRLDHIEKIHAAADRAYKLLENLLDWSRIQTGKIPFEPIRVELAAAVSETLSLFNANAEKKEIRIANNVRPGAVVFADPDMLKAVLRNLVSNAVKFTPRGGAVDISSRTDGGAETISISDTGVGVPPQEIADLFKIDVHHCAPGTEEEMGTGLGLILCGEFIEKNGGRIWAESRPGKGSRFSFSLPGPPSDA